MDRARPRRHRYRGINLFIEIKYGDDDQPGLAVITVEEAPGVIAVIELGVNNYDDALAIGIEHGERWVDISPA